MKTDILTDIIAAKRQEVEEQRAAVPLLHLEHLVEDPAPCHSMRRALEVSDTGIIAEFKRRSPSKGWIREAANAEQIVSGYVRGGASALSVLTDTPNFGGSLSDLRRVRARVDVPLLRKDFIIDPYQVWQSKAVGADVILLIATALTPEECRSLARLAHELRMEVLLELHDE